MGGVPLLVVSSISPIYGNAPSFVALDITHHRVPREYVHAWLGRAWLPTHRSIAHMNAANRVFFMCAQTELGDGYASCAGIPRRRDIAVLVVALTTVTLTSLPLLCLIRPRKRGPSARV